MKTIADLQAAKEKAISKNEERKQSNKYRVVVGMATCGIAAGAKPVMDAMVMEIEKLGINNVELCQTGCIGVCRLEPMAEVYAPDGTRTTYVKLDPEKAVAIINEHIVGGKVCSELTIGAADAKEGDTNVPQSVDEVEFFKKQMRVALKNCGIINPDSLEEYIANDGYQAFAKALTTMKPADVIEEVKKSGIRGRGGAGFPTGMKWFFASKYDADQKYVACNADEGDPGAFMDRSILEGDPHAVIEAMAIAGYAIGATKGFIYVRAEYPIAVKRLNTAIKDARVAGLLGENIFGTGFDFDLEIRLGAGAFVCGEETALMTSIEGHRGEPRPRPPFPAEKGIFGKPTVLNNVETYANIPQIILKGADWFSSIGTEGSKGTKVFALGGKVNNTGLVEVPMGTTVREVVYDIGGGIPGGKKFKAAQAGGPSGGCIPASKIDTPIDYDSLTAIGAMMGSGGLIVMDEDNCMVDIAKFFLDFTVDESCGKCPPCRIGTKRMYEMLEKITSGRGEEGDIEKLEILAQSIKSSAFCGLGQTAPNPVLSTIRYFRNEYEAHITEKYCASGVCKALVKLEIDPERCRGCTLCSKVCPVGAISGERKQPHVIDALKCIKCGACIEKCAFKAIYKK